METTEMKSLLLVMVICSLLVSINCSKDEDTVSKPLNGRTLFDIGLKTNNPMLRLIGKTMMEQECRTHMCSFWSKWSACEVIAGQFGYKSRTRQCGIDTNCGSNTNPRNETDTWVCQDFCPHDYEMTTEGFCLKFYNTTQKSWLDSKASCETSGGHLLNINSPMKLKSFFRLMEKYECTGYVYIDGKRKDVNSPWVFGYESDISGFTSWGPGEPDNASNKLCLLASYRGIGDYICGGTLYYVCEKLPSI